MMVVEYPPVSFLHRFFISRRVPGKVRMKAIFDSFADRARPQAIPASREAIADRILLRGGHLLRSTDDGSAANQSA